jgi:hypothetical protein
VLHETKKGMLSRLKREPKEWKKIFVTYSAHKRLKTRIYRELKKLNCQRVNYPVKNWASEQNTSLSKEEFLFFLLFY